MVSPRQGSCRKYSVAVFLVVVAISATPTGESFAGERLQIDGKPGRMSVIYLSPDGKTLLSLNFREVTLWNSETGSRIKQWPYKALYMTAGNLGRANLGDPVAFSPDSALVAIIDGNSRHQLLHQLLEVREARTGKVKNKIQLDRECHFRGLAFASDGATVALSGCRWVRDGRNVNSSARRNGPGVIRTRDLTTGKSLQTIDLAPQEIVGAICFSPYATQLAASMGFQVQIWDLKQRRLAQSIKTIGFREMASFTRDNQTLVLVCHDGKPMIDRCNLGTGAVESVALLDRNYPMGCTVALSGDGTKVAIASRVGFKEIHIVDTSTGLITEELPGHSDGMIVGLTLSNDARTLASKSSTGKIKIWDIKHAQPYPHGTEPDE